MILGDEQQFAGNEKAQRLTQTISERFNQVLLITDNTCNQ